jgi:hypothetical protein
MPKVFPMIRRALPDKAGVAVQRAFGKTGLKPGQ